MTAYLRVGGCSSAARVDHFLEACRRAALFGTAKHNLPPVVLCRLPGTWDGLLAEMSASTRKDLRQAERVMQRDYPDMAVEFLTDPADCQRALDVFFQLFHLRWGHASGGTLFDPPGAADCYRRAVDWAVRQGYGTVVTLRAAGEIHVIQTLFHLPGAPLYAQHIVRNTASMPRRYSPGIAVMNATLRWAIEHHFPILNLGYGATAYKLEYHGVAHPRCTLAAARAGFTSSVCPILDFALRIIRRSPVHIAFHARRLWRRVTGRAASADDS